MVETIAQFIDANNSALAALLLFGAVNSHGYWRTRLAQVNADLQRDLARAGADPGG
jgi:hypothetical protein